MWERDQSWRNTKCLFHVCDHEFRVKTSPRCMSFLRSQMSLQKPTDFPGECSREEDGQGAEDWPRE